ncbi:MAG: methyltransferase domain-containing protein [Cytophagales bacterium]|nr:methyltransferase domain-containing protein [Cytophagales bacterium]
MKTNNFKYGALIVIIGMLIFPLVMPKTFKKMIPVGVKEAIKNHFEVKTTTIVQNMDTVRIEKIDRESIANLYLTGNGIEIGALHLPLKVPPSASVKYVDILPKSELEKHYPELLKDYELVEVDIVDDGEYLIKIQNSSLNFVIACHFLEHCQNPIAAVENFLRVLKPGGILYLAVPDKRYTFDKDRPITSFEHLLKDYEEGPEGVQKRAFQRMGYNG